MVFPTCSRVSSSTGLGTDCYINIAYNQQLKLCSSSTDSGFKNGVRMCRPHGDLCTADPDFKFNLSNYPDNDVSYLPPNLPLQLTRLSYLSASRCHLFIPPRLFLCSIRPSTPQHHYLSSSATSTWMGSPTSSPSSDQEMAAFRPWYSLTRVRRMLWVVRRVVSGGAGGVQRRRVWNR